MRHAHHRSVPRFHAAAAVVALTGALVVVAIVAAPPGWATDGWTRHTPSDPLLGGSGNQLMQSVASTASGFVAVGSDDSVTAAAVWFSPDGSSWSRVAHQEGIFGGPDLQYMYDVVQGPGNAVIVGASGPSADQDAAVWTGGGTIWKRAKDAPAVFGGTGNQVMYSVAAAGPGLVAVGTDDSGGDLDAAVWTSAYGSTWTRVPHVEAVFGGAHRQWMKGVTAGGPGVVAVGMDESIDGSSDAAVWTSVNGTSWTQVPHSEAVFGGGNVSMYGVVAGGPGLVAVGHEITNGDSDAAVWTSVDGLTWTRVPHNESVFGGPSNQKMLDVAVGGPGLIAVGYDNDGTDRDAAVWTSPDGLTWTRVPHDEATFGGPEIETMNGIAVDATGAAVAAGTQWFNYDYDAALWTYTATAAPPPPPASPRNAHPSSVPATAAAPTATASSTASATVASPVASPSPTAQAAPADSPGRDYTPYAIAGVSAAVVAAAALGWFLARRRL